MNWFATCLLIALLGSAFSQIPADCPKGNFWSINTGGNSCKPCDIQNCEDCVLSISKKAATCVKCSSGYFLDVKNDIAVCTRCIDGCTMCKDATAAGCYKADAQFAVSPNGPKLVKCLSNCLFCDEENKCVKCILGYKLGTDNKCTMQCSAGCAECADTDGKEKCTKCLSNYYLSNETVPCKKDDNNKCLIYNPTGGQCKKCTRATFMDANKKCIDCPKGCEECTADNQCSRCTNGNFYFNSAAKECQACPANCATCGTDGKCITCAAFGPKFNKVLKIGNDCVESTIPGCVEFTVADKCTKCAPAMFPTADTACTSCGTGCTSCDKANECKACDPSQFALTKDKTCKSWGECPIKMLKEDATCTDLTAGLEGCVVATATNCLVRNGLYFSKTVLQCPGQCQKCDNSGACQIVADPSLSTADGKYSCPAGCRSCNAKGCQICADGYMAKVTFMTNAISCVPVNQDCPLPYSIADKSIGCYVDEPAPAPGPKNAISLIVSSFALIIMGLFLQ